MRRISRKSAISAGSVTASAWAGRRCPLTRISTRRVGDDVAIPVRQRTAGGGDVIVTFDFLVLQGGGAGEAALAPGVVEHQHQLATLEIGAVIDGNSAGS